MTEIVVWGRKDNSKQIVSKLKGSVCLGASKPNKMWTGVCNKKIKGFFKIIFFVDF